MNGFHQALGRAVAKVAHGAIAFFLASLVTVSVFEMLLSLELYIAANQGPNQSEDRVKRASRPGPFRIRVRVRSGAVSVSRNLFAAQVGDSEAAAEQRRKMVAWPLGGRPRSDRRRPPRRMA